jgi:tetratricopeptide (TPR) repeat protein
MNLSPPLQYAMTRINRALLQNDQDSLVQALQSVPLPELLSQDTLEKVRARGKSALVIFLATLASSNDIEPQAARFWLSCYQSIHHKTLSPELQALRANHVLRQTLEALMARSAGTPLPPDLSGTPKQWTQAFELAIDHKQWSLATQLLDGANKKTLSAQDHPKTWLQIAKQLAKRHDLFVDKSGQTHVDMDYAVLAQLYARCAQFLFAVAQKDAAIALTYLQAKCLEADRQFDQAVAVLRGITQEKKSEFQSCQINIARCQCKQGHLGEAIEALDQVIAQLVLRPRSAASGLHSGNELTGNSPQAEKVFNVANASRALADLATVLESHQVPFFLVSGTLLGYAREGQLLAHDKDIDVGILGWEQQYTIGMALQHSAKFSISSDFLKGERVYYIPISHNETGFIIDLFFYHEENGKYVTGVDFFFGHRQTFAFSPFGLAKTEFLGVPMYVPSDVDLKLRENFGDWRQPDPGYISHLQAPCTVNPGGADYMLTARLQLITALNERKTHKVQRIAQILARHAHSPWAMKSDLHEALSGAAAAAALMDLRASAPREEPAYA